MAEYWIQLENRPWDLCPNNIDRMTGQNIKDRETSGGTPGPDPVNVTLVSFAGGSPRVRKMFKPLMSGKDVVDALILRRYNPPTKPDGSDAWSVPDDRKVNPWDLNEPDPSEATGTMGTIPGPVIELGMGEEAIVHFRNMDQRTTIQMQKICIPIPPFGQEICFEIPVPVPIPIEKRLHSLHPHGVVFEATSDGAYPLSPPDPAQPIPAGEAPAWASVPKFAGNFKQGDRVPPGGTFTYHWRTFGWPTTAGVWLYHDHSVCDEENVQLGAIGIVVIHNAADKDNEVDLRLGDPNDPTKYDPAFLPGGDQNGSPVTIRCFPLADVGVLPGHLALAAAAEVAPAVSGGMSGMEGMTAARTKPKKQAEPERPEAAGLILHHGDLTLELSKDLLQVSKFCLPIFRTPPAKALFLQLFHSLTGGDTVINGRQYLGNTPTMVSGTGTKMRFGVVGMGSEVHTFHIHGHRWIIPGPDGTTPIPAIQNSPQVRPVSQFEDTRVFGPANSFVFTIQGQSGSFMRAGGPGPNQALGEWHMHCHVLMHMMSGMMGSLLILNGGELAFALPSGVPCPEDMQMNGGGGGGPKTVTVTLQNIKFNPQTVNIKAGDTVHWVWQEDNHSTTSDAALWDSGVHNNGFTFDHTFPVAGSFPYHCVIHGGPGVGMFGTVVVT